jgi:hypothetical protein
MITGVREQKTGLSSSVVSSPKIILQTELVQFPSAKSSHTFKAPVPRPWRTRSLSLLPGSSPGSWRSSKSGPTRPPSSRKMPSTATVSLPMSARIGSPPQQDHLLISLKSANRCGGVHHSRHSDPAFRQTRSQYRALDRVRSRWPLSRNGTTRTLCRRRSEVLPAKLRFRNWVKSRGQVARA